MSNDLISRKALLMEFRCSYNGRCLGGGKECEKCNDFVCRFKDVQNQPTAYDIDKVVEQLESLETYKQTVTMEKHPFCASEIETVSKKKAIEIVKGNCSENPNSSSEVAE